MEAELGDADAMSEPVDHPASPPSMSFAAAKRRKRIIIAAVLFALMIGGMVLRSATPNHGDAGGAESACRDAVRAQLRAPGTASFSDERATHAGDAWTVVGAVDAENGFGANLRSPYSCGLTFDGSAFSVDHVAGIDGGTNTGFGAGDSTGNP